MSISAISSGMTTYQTAQTNSMANFKKDFESLSSALESGNLEDAKKAYAQYKKDAPKQSGNSDNPMSKDLDALGKALDSGDLTTAKDVFSKIQDKISQGPPPGSAGSAKTGAAAGSGTQTDNKTYDKKDINKDGTVSTEEEMLYDMTHPADTAQSQQSGQSSGTSTTGIGNKIDIRA